MSTNLSDDGEFTDPDDSYVPESPKAKRVLIEEDFAPSSPSESPILRWAKGVIVPIIVALITIAGADIVFNDGDVVIAIVENMSLVGDRPTSTPTPILTATLSPTVTASPLPSSTPTVLPTSTATPIPTITLTQTTAPTNTSVPVQRTTVEFSVPGNVQDGVIHQCLVSGNYLITIIGGAYSPWDENGGPRGDQWRTRLNIYRNSETIWGPRFGKTEPLVDASVYTIGENEEYLDNTKVRAENLGVGSQVTIPCEAGEYLRFVPIDVFNAYGDNTGEVVLRIEIQ